MNPELILKNKGLKLGAVALAMTLAGAAHATDGSHAFGITEDGTVYHHNGGQSASFVFLCVDDVCPPDVSLDGDFYQAKFDLDPNETYNLTFKIQDNATGQCIVDAANVAVGGGVLSSSCTDFVGTGIVEPPEKCDIAPTATIKKITGETDVDANNGKVKVKFPGDGSDDHTNIVFSLDGGLTTLKSFKDSKGKGTLKNIEPGTYTLTSTWEDGSCQTNVGEFTIEEFIPIVECEGVDSPTATAIATGETTEGADDGTITFNFAGDGTANRTKIKFSLDGGSTYLPTVKDKSGSFVAEGIAPGTYDLVSAWGDGSCATDLPDVTVLAVGEEPDACTGIDMPAATAFAVDESAQNANDGKITFTFENDAVNGGTRENLNFSIDGGNTYSDDVSDNQGTYTLDNLTPGDYDLFIRWGNNECPTDIADVTVKPFKLPGECPDDEEPPGDPKADFGDYLEAGITTSGIAYHSEQTGASRGFAIWGLQGSAPNVAGQTVVHTTQDGSSYNRYEVDLGELDAQTTYQLEMRLQGDEFGGGQCIQQFSFKPGEGTENSQCFDAGSTGGDDIVLPPAPEQTVAMKVTDAVNNKARLVAGEYAEDKAGYALYYFADDSNNVSNCFNGCEDNWPKVLVDSVDDLIGAGGLTGEFGTIPVEKSVTNECGEIITVTQYHVTYNQQPLYFFAGDTSANTTAGKDINKWSLADADLIPQLPLVKNPAPALLATINGLEPNNFGFAIDIEGRTLSWRPSAINGNRSGLIQQFSAYGGENAPLNPTDPNLELWCSNNQIEFHKADMPGSLGGPYTTEIPGSCYGEFYYFLRYKIIGTVNNNDEDRWVYTALFVYDETRPNNRMDPRNRPTVTYGSANWQRHGHPHSRDRVEEAILIDAMPYNTSPLSGLERYSTTFVDGPNTFNIQPNANGSVLRIEAFEWGAGNCQGPQYQINANNPMSAGRFDYGQIISWEATFGSSQNNFEGGTSIGSQIYNTMQNTTVGQGFTTSTGDPRLNSSGRAGVRMVHSDGCNPVEKEERNARFAQQITTVQTASVVNDFILGHNQFHGLPEVSGARVGDAGFTGSKAIVDVNGTEQKAAGMASCGDCHFRDGRSSFVVETAKGPRLAPPTYGTGLLEWIEGAEVGLTWDGSVATVREQAELALQNDHGLTPSQIGQTNFDRIVTYTETLHVPVREYSSYADPEVAEGELAFHEAGCADCHQPTQKTRSDAPVEFRDIYIRPYTDMKLWNVGTGGSFRTSPLWGIGENEKMLKRNGKAVLYMHDGRASTLSGAIDAHGNGSVQGLSGSDKAKIVKFLSTL